MGWAYIVLAAMAALGAALGWRLTPEPREDQRTDGLARLLQLGIAMTGLLVLAALLVPWFMSLDQISCTTEAERAGKCIIGLQDRGLFGVSIFVCLIGSAFAFVLRKGVFDAPDAAASQLERDEHDTQLSRDRSPAGLSAQPADADVQPADSAQPAGEDSPTGDAPTADAPTTDTPIDDAPAAPASEANVDADEADNADAPSPARGVEPEPDAEPHRRLEGPVFRAFVDDDAVELERAIEIAAARLRSERVAVVFSRGASKAANVALLELAEAFNARRYVLEGSAAATEGVPREDAPDPTAVDEVVGPGARHAGELALALAGSLIQTVFLLDTRVAFPAFVLGKLTELQSVCIAHAHDEVSGACQVVLPGTNPGEREGELIDSDGGTNARRTREWLVGQIVAALAKLEASEAEAKDDHAREGQAQPDEASEAEAQDDEAREGQ